MRKTTLKTWFVACILLVLANYSDAANRSWDWTNWSTATLTNLAADGVNWNAASSTRFANKIEFAAGIQVLANGTPIAEMSDITFNKLPADRLRLDYNTNPGRLMLNGSNYEMRIANCLAGEVLTVVTMTASTGNARGVTATNATRIGGEATSADVNTNIFTVDADGTVVLKTTGGLHFRTMTIVMPSPETTVDVTPLAFYYQFKYGPSTSKLTTIQGRYLTGNVVVTPPTNFEISTNNATFQTTPISLAPTSGTLALTPIYVRLVSGLNEGAYAGTLQVASNGATTQNVPLAGVVGLAPELPKLVVNEFFASAIVPTAPGQGGIPLTDANNDGVISATDDQFIEIYNNSSTKVNIGTYKIKVNGVTKHIFPAGSFIPAYSVIVVFGGGTPTGFPEGVASVASSGGLGLSPSGGIISLTTDNGQIINEQAITYGTEAGNYTSIARNPEGTGSFVLHNSIAPQNLVYSPGANVNGGFYSPIPVVPISWVWIVALFGLIALVVVIRKIKLI